MIWNQSVFVSDYDLDCLFEIEFSESGEYVPGDEINPPSYPEINVESIEFISATMDGNPVVLTDEEKQEAVGKVNHEAAIQRYGWSQV